MITEKVREILDPIAKERKYFIVEVTYKREGNRFVLRVIVDKQGGITMDECAALNNELNERLDMENLIEEQYMLEVSSPGLDRKLKDEQDFVWAVGKRIEVTTYTPLEGRNVFSGLLVGLGEDTLVIDEDGISWEIPREKIASARLYGDRSLGRFGGDRSLNR